MFGKIISVENLLLAWREFSLGKRTKTDVRLFERNLMDNILQLHIELANKSYRHGPYVDFRVWDPKPRHIHKALVRDRLVHHAVHRILYPFFDEKFISDSFSCRIGKGVHAAGLRFRYFTDVVSRKNTCTCWVLKCDIKKFFASIHQEKLHRIMQGHISDENTLWLLTEIIESFHMEPGRGLPLGNLTSQLFANIYMNELDQYIKHALGVKHYIRYADDFVFVGDSHEVLRSILPEIELFLLEQLGLRMHPRKIIQKTLVSGIDFLGWIYFPNHKVMRSATRRRALRRTATSPTEQTLNSYLCLMQHGNAFGVSNELRNIQFLYGSSFSDRE